MTTSLTHRALTVDELSMLTDALLLARQNRPYYATALAALTPFAVDGLGTVGVDKFWRLYVDPKWFASLPIEQRAAVLAGHEIEHLLRRHAQRAEMIGVTPETHQKWNIAGDMEINDDCELPLPKDAIHPKVKGKLAEDYYEELPDPIKIKVSCNCGSGADGQGRDYEIPGEGKDGKGPEVPAVSGEDAKRLIAATAAAVRAHIAANGQGSVPAGIAVWADEVAAPVPPVWQRVVATWVGRQRVKASNGRADYDWKRPSRRSSAVIRPRLIGRPLHLALIVDTSGSMSGDGAVALGVVAELRRAYPEIDVWDTDAAAIKHKKGQAHKGGGGTNMGEGFKAIAKAGNKIDGCIVVTDGMTPWPSAPPYPVCVVLTQAADTPGWAETVKV